MRSHFYLIPAAVIVSALAGSPALAGAFYLTAEQAQSLLFPEATFTESFHQLTDGEIKDIQTETDVKVRDRRVRAWRVSTGGWFIIDQVKGRDDTVTYALGLDASGIVTGIEIIKCWPHYSQIRLPAWRAQFIGKTHGTVDDGDGIKFISRATLSSRHITEGVTRILATFAIALASPPV